MWMKWNNSRSVPGTAVAWLLAACIAVVGCETGVDESADPGVIRVTLQPDPTDNSITIGDQTYDAAPSDRFEVTIFQGKLYRDSSYATLFADLDEFREIDRQYDLLTFDDGEPARQVIFETFVAPGRYDSLQFGMTASMVRIGALTIPAQLPPGTGTLLEFDREIEIFENDTTIVDLTIKPFQSVRRFRDSFHFTRELEITGVSHR